MKFSEEFCKLFDIILKIKSVSANQSVLGSKSIKSNNALNSINQKKEKLLNQSKFKFSISKTNKQIVNF